MIYLIGILIYWAIGAACYVPLRMLSRVLKMRDSDDPQPAATVGGLVVCCAFAGGSLILLVLWTMVMIIEWIERWRIWKVEL